MFILDPVFGQIKWDSGGEQQITVKLRLDENSVLFLRQVMWVAYWPGVDGWSVTLAPGISVFATIFFFFFTFFFLVHATVRMEVETVCGVISLKRLSMQFIRTKKEVSQGAPLTLSFHTPVQVCSIASVTEREGSRRFAQLGLGRSCCLVGYRAGYETGSPAMLATAALEFTRWGGLYWSCNGSSTDPTVEPVLNTDI